MDDGDKIKAVDTELDQSLKNMLPTKGSRACPEDERDVDQRNGVGKNSSRVQKLWNAKMTIFQTVAKLFIWSLTVILLSPNWIQTIATSFIFCERGKAAYIRPTPIYNQDPCALATMINHITWDTNMFEPFLEVDVKLNLRLEIYTRPFILLPTSAVEGPGNIIIQALLDRLIPLLLQQVVQDCSNWVQL
ncbi:hypothetical protein ES288_A13G143600v1 [Gossypium darwinii]|uniref:Uncharacterized protein n=1 Tax=Gossypium darwinii TaxID=34276 RepID=A0A5D2E072_GOSDA|nr:hypothetical protein ES288_A13G143600v1 [Gossypium darwinii]